MKANFTQDVYPLPPGEQRMLQEAGIGVHQYRQVHASSIDYARSALNQARIKAPLIPSHVEDMAIALLDGATLPALILCDDGEEKLVIWSGNNRAAAYKEADITEFPAVIIKCNDAALLDMMPRILNRCGGMKLDAEEGILQAIYAIETYAWTQPQAAKAFGISEGQLNRHIRAGKIREQLEGLNVKTGKLANAHMIVLSPLSSNDNVLEKVAQIALDAKIASNDLGTIVREVRAVKSESKQLDVATKLYMEMVGAPSSNGRAGVGTAGNLRSKASLLRMHVSALRKLLNGVANVKQLDITDRGQIEIDNFKLRELAAECLRVAAGKTRRRKAD